MFLQLRRFVRPPSGISYGKPDSHSQSSSAHVLDSQQRHHVDHFPLGIPVSAYHPEAAHGTEFPVSETPAAHSNFESPGPTPAFCPSAADTPHNTHPRHSALPQPPDSQAGEGIVDAMGAMTQHGSPEEADVILGDMPEETQFYGGSSVASFMKDVQNTIQRANSSNTTTGVKRPTQLRMTQLLTRRTLVEMYALPPRSFGNHLLQSYFQNAHSLYPFFHRPSFIAKYEALWSGDGTRFGDGDAKQGLFYACINAVFAVGCLFSSSLSLHEREENANSFFERCKPFVRGEILDVGSLELVQTLLTMAQYFQVCRRHNSPARLPAKLAIQR
jgi:hypothetical protein